MMMKDIKADKIPQHRLDKPARLRQKNRKARWSVKSFKATVDANGETHMRSIAIPAFGCKNHISIDKCHDFSRSYFTISASTYDGEQFKHVLCKDNTASKVWFDSAYHSKGNEEWLKENGFLRDIYAQEGQGESNRQRSHF